MTGYWSPVGLKSAFFECTKDTRGLDKCLAGTQSDGTGSDSGLAVVSKCAAVRPQATLSMQ